MTDYIAMYEHLADRARILRLRLQSFNVEPGSAMHSDDLYLTPVMRSFQELVWQFLGSAVDHLRVIGTSGSRQPATSPFAFATLARTAITTAATALWFLNDDQVERRVRILEIIAADLVSYAQFRTTIKEAITSPEDAQEFEDETQVLDTRTTWIVTEHNSLTNHDRSSIKAVSGAVTDTGMVRAAGLLLEPMQFIPGLQSDAELVALWQLLSGYAHGRPWAYQAAKTHGPTDANGLAPTTISGDPELILGVAAIAVKLVEIACDTADNLSRADGNH
ncbi:hypothetical protein [Gordonia aichiensis]|uniref:Uncharacterized protein n=1 Tax=Gordonia aichiensis NBRC 108223 TaxID=1220583 RepID=L7KQL0_9ACTN|nr:hypothetical protein [Gordonia aichiensis]GAC51140.1 hypothetical protein GOACH_55_00020 [Gordonia aichiensis NBRC 108223]